ncbi:MAG: chromate transporter, partial [Sphingomonas bacterium]|nr:chromate transporter [Sphingomonas bacterium]
PFALGPVRFDVPVLASADPWALLLSIAAMVAIFRLNMGVLVTLGAASAAAVALHLLGLIG